MNDIRICFIGDSFINGTGDPEKLGWVSRLKSLKQTDITVYNLGIRGNTSMDIHDRWEQEVHRRLPEHSDNRLVFSFGVNDTVMQDGQFRVSENTSIEISRLLLGKAAYQYKTLMIGPPPIDDSFQNERIHALDLALHTVCKKTDIPYLSVFQGLSDNDTWMKEVADNDGAHPMAGGYSELARMIENWQDWWFS